MEESDGDDESSVSFHGDILESIFSRLPLIHLLHPLRVSKSWTHAVLSSLRNRHMHNRPWLILHRQSSRSTSSAAFSAYDPRSALWIRIEHPPYSHSSALRSSHATLLYTLSPAGFSFSMDPLHLTWRHAPQPSVWRTEPVVAAVGGRRVVVAGGVCDFEDDPLAVEMYDLETGTWETCESMPSILKNSAASTWLSVAADERRMYVMEKQSGFLYYFDTDTKKWSVPYNVQFGGNTCFSVVIGFCRRGLIAVGLCGDSEETRDVRLWELDQDELDKSLEMSCREIGSVPEDLTRKLKGESGWLNSIGVAASCMDDLVYVYNPDETGGEVVTFEVDAGDGVRRWGSGGHAMMSGGAGRVVYTCSQVRLGDLERATIQGFSFKAY